MGERSIRLEVAMKLLNCAISGVTTHLFDHSWENLMIFKSPPISKLSPTKDCKDLSSSRNIILWGGEYGP